MAMDFDILRELGMKKDNVTAVAGKAERNPSLVSMLLDGISSENARVRFKSAKVLRILSEQNPEKLYPQMDFFVDLLQSKNNIIKWNAIDIVANLVPVDSKRKFDRILDEFYGLLYEGSLITAGHVVANSWKIANARPKLRSRITSELLNVVKVPLPTEECRNILIGHAIVSLGQYFDKIPNKEDVVSFVRKQLKNSRSGTRKKAEKLLKDIEDLRSKSVDLKTTEQKRARRE
jgi:hypothetical protein